MALKKIFLGYLILSAKLEPQLLDIVGICWYNIEQFHIPFRLYFVYHRTLL